jgi:hypothetical protein
VDEIAERRFFWDGFLMRWILAVLALWLARAGDGERVRFLGGAEALRGGGLGTSSIAISVAMSVGIAAVGEATVGKAVVGTAVVGAVGAGARPLAPSLKAIWPSLLAAWACSFVALTTVPFRTFGRRGQSVMVGS